MSYTLEINHINPQENLFFWQTDTASEQEFLEYITPIVNKHIAAGTWNDPSYSYYNRKTRVLPRKTGEWQSVTTIDNFTSKQSAINFFQDIIADGTKYRTLVREWHQSHGILNETNILDVNGNVVEVIHACQARKCIRFTTCPDQGKGCNIVGSITSNSDNPIYHVKIYTPNRLFSLGKFAVIDLFHRHVWINLYDEGIAHEIRKTFWSKTACAVFDLSSFENYTENLIDTDVSLNWKIGTTDLTSPLTNISIGRRSVLEKTHRDYVPNKLINEKNSAPLHIARLKELQEQMLLYFELLKVTELHSNDSKYMSNPKRKEFFADMNKIFSSELYLCNIEEKLFDLAQEYMAVSTDAAAAILKFFGRLYD